MQKRRPQGDSLRAALVFMGLGVQAASDRTAGVVAAASDLTDGTYTSSAQGCLSHSRCVTFGYNVAKTLAAL